MRNSFLIIVWIVFGVLTQIRSQSVGCSSFCVTNIELDSIETGLMNVEIFFEGTDENFINYPYVSHVINLVGDTLATGTLNFFGQIGNTSQTYPVMTVLDSIPDNFTAIVFFRYDSIECMLHYPCSTASVKEELHSFGLTAYPNPAVDNVSLFLANDSLIELEGYSLQGQLIFKKSFPDSESYRLDVSDWGPGLYLLYVQGRENSGVLKLLVNR